MNVVLIILVVLGGLSKAYKKFILVSIGIELKTLFTICIAFTLGPKEASVAAAAMVVIAAVVAQRFCFWILIKSLMYVIVSVVVFFFSGLGLFIAGTIGVITLNLGYVLINMTTGDLKPQDLPGNVFNIVFTLILLKLVGPFLVVIL